MSKGSRGTHTFRTAGAHTPEVRVDFAAGPKGQTLSALEYFGWSFDLRHNSLDDYLNVHYNV